MNKLLKQDIEILENVINTYETYNEMPYKFNTEIILAIEHILKEYKELLEITQSYNSIKQDMKCSKYKIVIADIRYFDKGVFKEKFIYSGLIKKIINQIDNDIKRTKEIISKNKDEHTKNDYQIVRLKAMNTKSKDIKNRLEKLLEGGEENG